MNYSTFFSDLWRQKQIIGSHKDTWQLCNHLCQALLSSKALLQIYSPWVDCKSQSCCCSSSQILILVISYFKWNSHPIICTLWVPFSLRVTTATAHCIVIGEIPVFSITKISDFSLDSESELSYLFWEENLLFLAANRSSFSKLSLPHTSHEYICWEKWYKLLFYITRRLKRTGLWTSGHFIHIWQKLAVQLAWDIEFQNFVFSHSDQF